MQTVRQNDSLVHWAGKGSGSGWLHFLQHVRKGLSSPWPTRKETQYVAHWAWTGTSFLLGITVGYCSTNSSPRSFISVLYTQWQGLWARPGHTALAQRTVVWVAKRMWLGSSGENPEHRSYCLLKVIFFFLPGFKHCSSQLPARGCVLLSEEESGIWGTWFHGLLNVENIPLPMMALAGTLSISS